MLFQRGWGQHSDLGNSHGAGGRLDHLPGGKDYKADEQQGKSHTVEYFNTSELFWIIFKQPLECHAGSTRDKPSHQERDRIGGVGGEVKGPRQHGEVSHDADSVYGQGICFTTNAM